MSYHYGSSSSSSSSSSRSGEARAAAPPGYHYMPDGSLMLDGAMTYTTAEALSITTITINPELERNLLVKSSDTEGGLKSHEVFGTLLPQALDKVSTSVGDYLMSYVVVAKSGHRYKSTPTLTFNSKLYNVESFPQLTDNPYEKGKKDITGVRFEIYKK